MSDHPGALRLERWSAGDLGGADGAQVAAHVAGCPQCRARVDELVALQGARLAAAPADRFLDEVASRRDRDAGLAGRRRWALGGSIGVGLLAAAGALVYLSARPVAVPADDLRLKGGGFTLVRKRGPEVRELAAADTVRAGDAIEVVAVQPRAATVEAWVVGVDGRIDRFVAGAGVPVAAGRQVLPGSMVIDPPCTDLMVVAAADGDISEAGARLAAAVAAARGIPDHLDSLPAGAWVKRLRCE